jgi:hypothetical protein
VSNSLMIIPPELVLAPVVRQEYVKFELHVGLG